MNDITKTSKFLSLILRHKPEAAGISLDEHGWADVEELLKGMDISRELLDEIVMTDEKNRYSFNEDSTKIRANQGHSVNVDVGLKSQMPPYKLYHGTAKKYVKSIEETGLISKSRLYVHLSTDIETATAVGKRHGEPVVYVIPARVMWEQGYEFYLSNNGVWLTEREFRLSI